MFSPPELLAIGAAAILIFGGTKIRDVARGLGAAKREFMVGQAEADVAAERARAEARATAESNMAVAAKGETSLPVTTPPASSEPPAAPN